MTDNNAGIDYGRGLSNIDHETGIRYGVISIHEVLQAWADRSEEFFGDTECPCCKNMIEYGSDECLHCHKIFDGHDEYYWDYENGPDWFEHTDEGYNCTQDADDTDIFILKSPYYTLCAFCSPCAPGAGYIMDTRENGVKVYCFGHDWFDSGKAPYPVYGVETEEIVEP